LLVISHLNNKGFGHDIIEIIRNSSGQHYFVKRSTKTQFLDIKSYVEGLLLKHYKVSLSSNQDDYDTNEILDKDDQADEF